MRAASAGARAEDTIAAAAIGRMANPARKVPYPRESCSFWVITNCSPAMVNITPAAAIEAPWKLRVRATATSNMPSGWRMLCSQNHTSTMPPAMIEPSVGTVHSPFSEEEMMS